MLEKNIPMIEAVAEVLSDTKEQLELEIAKGTQEIEKIKDAIKGFDDVVAKSTESLISVIKEQDEKASIEVASAIEKTKEEFERKIDEVSKSLDDTLVAIDMVNAQSQKIAGSIEESIQEVKQAHTADFEQLSKNLSLNVEKRLESLTNGVDGADGIDGKDGADGRDRPLIEAMVVADGDKIDKNTVVAHKGGLFISTRKANGTPDNDPAGYNCVLQGISDVTFTEVDVRRTKMLVDMADGLQVEHIINTHSPVFKGPFKKDATYENGDIVIKDKKTLIRVAQEGLDTDWRMFVFAEKGDKGDTGAGVQGPAGVGISDIFAEGSNILFEMTDGTVKAIGMELPDLEDNFEGARIKAFAGAWNSGDTYNAGDVVRSENGLWLALDSTTEFPSAKSTSWINMIYAGGSGGSGAGGGEAGPVGPQGPAGVDGKDGKSAYRIAVENGFIGTEAQWLASLEGADGTNGVDGTNGIDGVDGNSAYEIAVAGGFVGTEQQWLDSLVGADGDSAYEVAVAGGYVGTEAEWVASLKGEQGLGLRYVGRVATEADLATIANPVHGDIYIAEDNGNAYVWNSVANTWDDAGVIVGAEGPIGPQGEVGPTGVSADANNGAYLGTDNLVYVPKADGKFLPLAGGTMTGTINVPNGTPALNTASGFNLIGSVSGLAIRLNTTNLLSYSVNLIEAYKPVALPADPLQPLHAATKQFVESKVGAYLPLAGGAMTGMTTYPASAAGEMVQRFGNTPPTYWIKSYLDKLEYGRATTGFLTLEDTKITSKAPILLPLASPTLDEEAVNKKYVDGKFASGGYTLPAATATILGGVKVGAGLSVAVDGTLAADAQQYTLPPASATTLGGVFAKTAPTGSYVTGIDATGTPTFGAPTIPPSYTLPTASATVLGGIKVGTGLLIDGTGVLKTDPATGAYLPLAGGTMTGRITTGMSSGDAIAFSGGTNWFGFEYTGSSYLTIKANNAQMLQFSTTEITAKKPLLLKADPVENLEAATKQYVDSKAGGGGTSGLPLTGGTMTGTIVLPTTIQSLLWGTSTYNMFGASGGVAIRFGNANIVNFTATGATYTQKITTTASGIGLEFGSGGANLSRGSAATKIKSSGAIELPADPVAAMEAAPKQYVDNKPTIVSIPAGGTPPDSALYPNNTLLVEYTA